MQKLLPTTVVGSYPQPEWLVDHKALRAQGAPRVRAPQIWRVDEPHLKEAQVDATRLAIRDLEDAGIDIVTDGEIRRESYSNRFATALQGIDLENPHLLHPAPGISIPVPRVVGPIRRVAAVQVSDMEFLRSHTTRTAKITIPGPFTMSQQAKNDFYAEDEEMAMDFAAAVNDEARALEAAGADVIQLDEPWLRSDVAAARRYAIKVINRALEGLRVQTAIHLCFGYGSASSRFQKPKQYDFLVELAASAVGQISIETAQIQLDLAVLRELKGKTIILGVVDLSKDIAETPEEVAARIERAFPYISPECVMPAPDCGMKFMGRELAFAKLKALSAGAELVRNRLS